MAEKNIVDRINELCKVDGRTIHWLEQELGYSNGTISKWRNMKSKPPLEKVTAIAKILSTTPEYLYTGIEPDNKDAVALELFSHLTSQQKDWIILQLRGLSSGE